ncbi:MAG: SGNH/GDSL hydrolase family protein [Clostridia bacterium]|nr:SGNH/GDSL hydrolase family protein [Clostridia bacterium]MBQ2433605.1 SGNH/GDSL hydrolase family protein [Clostridia bacterium]
MQKNTLFVLGDSIGRGILFNEKLNRYSLCRNTFDTALKSAGVRVFNFAKMGMTSQNALSLMDRCEKSENAVAAIEFGGNDSDLNWNEVSRSPDIFHEAAVPVSKYEDNIASLAEKARKRGMRPVIVTPLPLIAEKFFSYVAKGRDENAIMTYLGSKQSIYRWQERYATAAIRAAHSAGCPVFDARSLFLNRLDFDSLIGPDGMHPNERGYKVLSDAVVNAWENGLTEFTESVFVRV